MPVASPRLDIDRLAVGLRLSGDPQRLEPVVRRVRGIAQQQVAQALRRFDIGASDLRPGDEAIVFIDRLDIQCVANSAWDDDAIAEQLARRIAAALHARLARDEGLRFRDRADFVAAAMLAAMDGLLAQRWWFDEFEGLASLGPSTVLRTLAINEGDNGLIALARLADNALARACATLSQADAARLVGWIERRDAGVAAPLRGLWPVACSLHDSDGGAHAWLQALVRHERLAPGRTGRAAARALHALCALQGLAAEGGLAGLARDGARATLRAALAARDLPIDWIAQADDAALGEVVDTLVASASPAPAGAGKPATLFTPWGGFFVLLARLERAPWWRTALAGLPARWPQASPLQRGRLARALACRLAARALQPQTSPLILGDPAVQAATGMRDGFAVDAPASLIVALLRDALRDLARERHPCRDAASPRAERSALVLQRLSSEAALRLIADTARAMPGLAGSSPAFVREQALAMPARVVPAEGEADICRVHVGRAPLDVLLVLSGLKRQFIAWPGAPAIQLVEEHGA